VTNRKKALGLLESGQYGLYQGFGSWDFSCLLGYWLPESETTTFAKLGFCYYSNPKSSIHNVTETAFRSFASGRSHWETADLGSLKTWSTLSCRKRLNAFVGAEDQAKAIKGFFSDCLREANEFKRTLVFRGASIRRKIRKSLFSGNEKHPSAKEAKCTTDDRPQRSDGY